MRPAGAETLALWREAGAWWRSEPQIEIRQFIDARGIRREERAELPSLAEGFPQFATSEPFVEDHREEICLRIRKVRDEKVAKACGFLPVEYIPPAQSPKPQATKYAALHAFSGYAFGRSSMLAEEIPILCAHLEIPAVLLADPFSLAGAVEFTKRAGEAGIKPLIGASFEMADGGELVLVARSKIGWRSLSRLVSACHLDEPRLFPLCTWDRLEAHREGLLCLTGGDGGPVNRALMRRDYAQAKQICEKLIGLYGRNNIFVQIERSLLPWERMVNDALLQLADELRLTPVAGGPITHACREHFPAQDALVCIESLCQIEEVVGRKPGRDPSQPQIRQPPMRAINAERYLRPPRDMAALFADRPDLLRNTLLIAKRCDPDILPGRTQLPAFCPDGDENEILRNAVKQGARPRHSKVTKKLQQRLDQELERIIRNGFAGHFLIAWDMCAWATSQGILHSGRGSVVDSAVAFCLGLSRIDAYEHDLHFDRFLPEDANKRPDIDIDFEADRRDDVRNYLSSKYGPERVATVCAFGAFGTRGIVREVGKVLGLPIDSLTYLTKRLHGGVTPDKLEAAIDAKPELRDSGISRELFHWVFRLAERLMDIPRNIRSHSSGVILSSEPICDTVPLTHSGVDGVQIIQWDKRSAKRCFDKFDVLCLRGNDVLSGTQKRIRQVDQGFSVEHLPLDDPETYRTMRSGQLIGIPQSASPAMRQAHIRLRTEDLVDASIVQAGIRPGVGGAVKINELIARRRGKPYSFSHPELERILGATYGIIVFQEQVDMLLQTFGGYSSDEAEEIREAIHKRRSEQYALKIEDAVVARVMGQGHPYPLAKEVYDLVAVFQGYGFAEGHALAFAEISVRSVWCQQNHPAEYFAALLDAQPAGYYGPCTLVNEARTRGVKILPPDVNASEIKFLVEDVKADTDPKIGIPNAGIRISLRQIKGLSKETQQRIVARREACPYISFFDFAARVRPDRDELERLILCGALDEMHRNRRELLWMIPAAQDYAESIRLDGNALPIGIPEPSMSARADDFSDLEKAIHERSILELDVSRHLMAFERDRVIEKGGMTSADAGRLKGGTKAFVVGHPIRLRFPPTASGKRVVFFDLEDETGLLNVTCFNETYLKDGHTIVCSPYVTVVGEAQDRDGHIAFLAHRVFPYRSAIHGDVSPDELPLTVADFLAR